MPVAMDVGGFPAQLVYTSWLHHFLYGIIIACVKGKVKYFAGINIKECKMFYDEIGGEFMRRPLMLIALLACSALISACDVEGPVVVETPLTPQTFSQWASAAEASSQFGFPDWGVNRATGAPEIQACKDDSRAWSSALGNGVEWLRLTHTRPVYATEVRVYQNFGRGAISRISLIDETGTVQRIWEGTDTTEPCPGALVVSVPQTTVRIVGVLIDLDESRTGFWNQIDAVELIGVR
jgi:hypothetical protein